MHPLRQPDNLAFRTLLACGGWVIDRGSLGLKGSNCSGRRTGQAKELQPAHRPSGRELLRFN